MTTSNLVSANSGASSAEPLAGAGTTGGSALDTLSAWYGNGERIPFDPQLATMSDSDLRVFIRREGDLSHAVTFLPGYPDGSSGWANVLPHLPDASAMPKLFLDYVGMGDSDKPDAYRYSTAERADLVEALWRKLGVRATTVIAFDFSSLVVLEHLRRRLECPEAIGWPEIRGVFIFNGGLFADGHSHPWWTTPVLRRLPAWMEKGFEMQSFAMFMMLGGVMWSRRFSGRREAGRRVYESLRRHGGFSYLSRAAGFAAEHKQQGERLDFGRLFMAWRRRFPMLVGGSDDDAFEHRQIDLAEQRLKSLDLEVARLPGGHMTTDEQPRALAELIARFAEKADRWQRGSL